jgi:hypothetical protein
MNDKKAQSKVYESATTPVKEEDEEDDDDEDDDGECDDSGSRVVATLCRKVNTQAAEKKLVIAVVVSSSGDRHDAQRCAKDHMEKLKNLAQHGDTSNVITCGMIARMNPKKANDDAENSDHADGHDAHDSSDADAGTKADHIISEDEQDAGSEEKKLYGPNEFMELFYKTKRRPLFDSGAEKQEVIKLLDENASDLRTLNMKTTWIIPHSSVTGNEASATDTYYTGGLKTIGYKTVVVVLSAFFLLQKPQTTTPTKTQSTKPANQSQVKDKLDKVNTLILVCSIPALIQRKDAPSAFDQYREALSQVKRFIEHYNNQIAGEEKGKHPKIERIALSYPHQLYEKLISLKTKKNVKAKKGKVVNNKAGAPSKNGAKKAADSDDDSDEDYASDDDDDDDKDEDQQEDGASKQSSKGAKANAKGNGKQKTHSYGKVDGHDDDHDHDGEQGENDDWLNAVSEMLDTLDDAHILLMCDQYPPWRAPEYVKRHFNDTTRVIQKFPNCIDINNDSAEDKINSRDVPSTLFVCDREAGKMVGNENTSNTTGGVFGSWVPMHYTAVRVNNDTYSNAGEINKLIAVI